MNAHRTIERFQEELLHEAQCLPGLDPGALQVKRDGSDVTLVGTVHDVETKGAVETLARHLLSQVPGVHTLHNHLHVKAHHHHDTESDAGLVRAVVTAFGHGSGASTPHP